MPTKKLPKVAYFCMEYALDSPFKIYAGGLGILAGDYLKGVKDHGYPLVGLGIRWKHTAFVTYQRGDWSTTLRQQYSGKYAGYVPPGMANGTFTASATQWDPIVKPYTLHHANLSYTGIKNLLDKDPPYANSYDTNTGSGSSWEPRVADPRGRSFVLGVDYKFF